VVGLEVRRLWVVELFVPFALFLLVFVAAFF
jgi:hypothetical protein